MQIAMNLLYFVFSLGVLAVHLWSIALHTHGLVVHLARFIQLEIIFLLFQVNAIICPLIQNMAFVLRSAKYSLIICLTFCIAMLPRYPYASLAFLLVIASQYEEMFQTYITSINNFLDI